APVAEGAAPKVEVSSAQRFVVMALSRTDGEVLWERTATETKPNEGTHLDGSWASASPITDGERLFAFFGSYGIYAYDLDGKLLWSKDLGDMQTRNAFGEGSSPAVWGDTLVINWDHEGDSFIVALDKHTGEERWRVARPGERTSWSTPLVVAEGGKPQVIVAATERSRGYDLATGEVLWQAGGMTVNVIPSPVYADGMVYLMSGFRGSALQAIRLSEAKGELSGPPAIVWSHDRDTPYVPSPLLYDGKLYFLKVNTGILSVLDAKTGQVLYNEQRLDGIQGVYASPVGAAGRVYLVGRNGVTLVLKNGDRFEQLASNTLDDRFDASPAVVGGEIFLRGHKHLYCLAQDARSSTTQPSLR
ncbi:MAG: PQQ-like beta-propeller repeat protein, partial [Thermoanaerobaculia bacterium]|nr:PQQ-like beta-propeller repeat protein [Thermoanaerobaculia bacterium]